MNVLDYMIDEVVATRNANRKLAKAFVLVSVVGLSSLYSLSKKLDNEKERRYKLQKEMDELAETLNKIHYEPAKDNVIVFNKGE